MLGAVQGGATWDPSTGMPECLSPETDHRLQAATKLLMSTLDGNQMIPWTAPRLGPGMPASKLLLDLDRWAEIKWDKALDIVAAGIVSGVVEI